MKRNITFLNDKYSQICRLKKVELNQTHYLNNENSQSY